MIEMLIELDPRCSIFAPENEVHLHALLHSVLQGRHHIAKPEPEQLQTLVGGPIWRVYGTYILQAYKAVTTVRRKLQRQGECHACDPEVLAHYYSQPLLIVVENSTTDGLFLKEILARLAPTIARLFQGMAVHIKIEQAGGIGEIPKVVRSAFQDNYMHRPMGVPVRIIAICDSDRQFAGHDSPQAREVQKCENDYGITAHVLRKRSIENYIPDDALLEYSDQRRDRVEAAKLIVSLTGDARDYYPMKAGLSSDEIESSTLFPSNFPVEVGMGDFVNDLLVNFPYVVRRNSVEVRDGVGELRILVSTIERLL